MLSHHLRTASHPVLSADHTLGPAAAPVIILKYGCYCCPREAQAHAAIRAILDVFPEQVCFIYRHFPLVVSYPTAFDAAEAAEAAAAQGQFWRMHHYLAENARPYTHDELIQIASHLGLNAETLARDLDSHTYRDLVTAHFQSGVRSSVRRVPAIFVNGQPFREEITVDGLRRRVAQAGAKMPPSVGTPFPISAVPPEMSCGS